MEAVRKTRAPAPTIAPLGAAASVAVCMGGMKPIASLWMIVASAVIATLLAGPARAGTRLYVTAEDGNEVVVVDADRGEVAARIAVGKRPRGIKLSRDGKHLFVALSGSPKAAPGADESKLPPADREADGVAMIDIASGQVVRTYRSGQDPESFDFSLNGKQLYVSNEETAEMTVLDLASGKVIRRVPIGSEPEGVTVRPDGKVVYVTSEQQNEVVAVDTRTFKVVGRMATGPRPRSVVFSKDGQTGFATCENGAMVTVLDGAKHKVTGSITIEAKAKTVLGPRPMGGVLAPDGKLVYISNGRGESIAVIDVATRKVVHLIDGVGARPWGIGVSADGKRLFTANGPSQDVSIIKSETGEVTKRVKVGGSPWGLAVTTTP